MSKTHTFRQFPRLENALVKTANIAPHCWDRFLLFVAMLAVCCILVSFLICFAKKLLLLNFVEAFKKRFRPGLYIYDGASKRSIKKGSKQSVATSVANDYDAKVGRKSWDLDTKYVIGTSGKQPYHIL